MSHRVRTYPLIVLTLLSATCSADTSASPSSASGTPSAAAPALIAFVSDRDGNRA
jgi:hypothetical protein